MFGQPQLADHAGEVLRRRLPGGLGDHVPEQDVVGVVVDRLLVRRGELRGVRAHDRQRVVVGPRQRRLGRVAVEERLVVGEVVGPAPHRQQVAHRDRVTVRDVGDVARDRVGERDLALVDEPEHGVGGERLRDAGDAVVQVGRDGRAGRVGGAVGPQDRAPLRVDDAHHRAGDAVLQARRGGGVDRGELVGGEAGRRGRGRRRRWRRADGAAGVVPAGAQAGQRQPARHGGRHDATEHGHGGSSGARRPVGPPRRATRRR